MPLWDDATRERLVSGMNAALADPLEAHALVDGKPVKSGPLRQITSPAERSIHVGSVWEADEAAVAVVGLHAQGVTALGFVIKNGLALQVASRNLEEGIVCIGARVDQRVAMGVGGILVGGGECPHHGA